MVRPHWGLREEIYRKIIHLGAILFLVTYLVFSHYFNHQVALFVLSALLIIMVELEFFRVEWSMKLPVFSHLWRYRRTKELHRLGADVFFLLGSIICLAIFDLRIAAAAILMTVFGDLAAAVLGRMFGRTWVLKGRALEGIIPEFLVNIAVGYFVVRTMTDGVVWWMQGFSIVGDPIWPVIITMALVATVVETLLTKLDDNLLVPVFAGFFGQIALLVVTGHLF